MAGLLEQYEQSSQLAAGSKPPTSKKQVPGAVMAPIFSKQKVNFKPVSPITHLVVSNNQLTIAMANKTLLRIDLLNPDNPQEVDLTRETTGSRIQHLFLDPSGQHLLISTVPREGDLSNAGLLYIGGRTTKPRLVSSLRGQLISAVGWNHLMVKSQDHSRTGPILVGNSQGVISELELCAEEGMFSRLETYTKQVCDVGEQRSPAPVTGIEYHRVPDTDRYAALVSTPCRLYQFVETISNHEMRPLLPALFNGGGQVSERFLEIPSTLSFSRLAFFYPTAGGPPEKFAWLTEPGVLYGELDMSGADSILGDTQLIPHNWDSSAAAAAAAQQPQTPRALALTQFHVLTLQAARVRATCVLDQRDVFEDLANEEHGPLVTICRDGARGTLWSASERAVYKYRVTDESRDVWRLLLRRRQFGLARQLCASNPDALDTVVQAEAEAALDGGHSQAAALLFAGSRRRLEDVALLFMDRKEYTPLREFLALRLERLEAAEGGGRARLQRSLLVFWCLELMLTQLGQMRDAEDAGQSTLRAELVQFLMENSTVLGVASARKAVYELMWRHGDAEVVLALAEKLQDWSTVVKHQLTNHSITKALETLRQHPEPELMYRHVPQLMGAEPTLTVELLMAQGRKLRAALLIPRLILADTSQQQGRQILRYLEFCVQTLESQCQVAHNYLVTLYVRHQPAKLMVYLRAQGTDRHCVNYSPGHVLRQCWSTQPAAAVHVLTVEQRYQEAVQLALTHDVALAKEVANRLDDDDVMKRSLWLQIAKHTIQHDQDVARTVRFLAECPLLHIEDVLPFFPDFVTIDDFREAICDSLQTYNEHIEELRAEMREATAATEVLREEISDYRKRCLTIQASDTCETCGHQLLTRPLYAFPCGHKFHQDCLATAVAPHLTPEQKRILNDLQQKLSTLPDDDPSPPAGSSAATGPRAEARDELDALIASECLYCGDLLIRCLDDLMLNDFPEDDDCPQR